MKIVRAGTLVCGLLLLVVSMSAGISAEAVTAPEIDGSSLSAAVGVLAAGVLILRARMHSK